MQNPIFKASQKFIHKAFLILLLVVFSMLNSKNSEASHMMGMDLTYVCLGGNDYEFTINLYRDCSGVNAPGSLTININSASCGSTNTLLLTATGPGVDISPLCASATSTCAGGANPGVEHWEYKGTFTLPMNCPDWNFSYALCCRNNSITNLIAPSSESLYIESTLDNSSGLCNTSPNFSTLPVPYICKGQLVNYNLGSYDADGDSLVYSLINALGAGGTPLAYVVPYTPTYPITTDSGFVTFDSLSGNLSLAPDTFQTCIVTVLVQEYRNGVLIGSIMRDIQVLVLDCPGNIQPNIVSPLITNFTGGGVLIDSNTIEVCVGIPVNFDLTGTDPDTADSVYLVTNLSTVIPAATFDTTGINPVLGSFSWIPTNSDLGLNTFSVTVEDNSCPIIGRQTYLFEIRVLQGVYAGPDINLCGTDSVQLVATGSTSYGWSPGTGLSDSTIANPMAFPSSTTTYIVTGDSTGACEYVDTMTINVVADFTLAVSPDTLMCDVAGVGISATPNPAGTYTYLWAPAATLDDETISNPFATPTSTTLYTVTVTSAAGCEKMGSINVTVNDPISVNIFPGDTTICPGSSFVLNSGVTGSDMQDDFDPGIDMSQWSTVVATASTNCGSVTGNALYFNDAGVREAITFDLNVSSGGTVEFYLKIANGTTTPCESADLNEDVVLEYSINGGGTWFNINTYTYNLFPNFTLISETVPIAAQTSSTRFRWRQLQHSGACCDHWALDDISITGSGGSFGYAWTPASGLSATDIPTPIVAANVTTTYTVDVSNLGNGCVVSDSVTITVLPEMTLTIGSLDATCDSSDGTAYVSVTGGAAPYIFLWDDPLSQANDSALNVPAGAYTVLVTDTNSCSKSDIVSVNDAGAATVSIVTSTDVSCFGGSDGSAEIGASGGSPPYTYSWDDPGLQTDSVAVGLMAGTYSGTVSDTNGCEATATIVITEPFAISTFMSNTDATCGLPNGDATVLASGGTGPFTYLWTDTAFQTTATATALAPGTYYVTVTDSLSCSVMDSIDVNSLSAPTATVIGSNVTFYGGNDGFAIVTTSGGLPPYTYLWDDPASQTSLFANTLTAGTYTVTVTDADTCIAIVIIVITEPPAIDVSVVSIDSLATGCNQVIMVTILNYGDTLFAGDTIPMSYDVNSSTVLEDFILSADLNTGSTVTFSFTVTANLYATGTYNISSWSSLPGDGDNSNDTVSTVIISTFPLSVNATADTIAVCFGDTANLMANVNSSDCSQYTVAASAFAPMAGTGTAVSLTDDELSAALPIGFSFTFYCNTYTNFHISSNGYLTFDPLAGNGCCSGQTLPDAFDPNDLIAFAWSDLDPGGGAGTIEYFTVGTTPNRILVVNFIGVPHFPGPSPNFDVTTQVLLYETSNVIEMHTTNMPTDGGIHTMGLENIDGTDAITVAGRNGTTTWSATNEAFRFAPLQIPGYSIQWIDPDSVLIDTTENISVTPDSTITYTVIATDLSNGCTVIDSITITGSSQILLTTDSTDASCGSADGTASVSVVDGVAPLTYLWDDPGTQTTDTATALDIGVYNVLVTDANGCSQSSSVSIGNVGAPAVDSTSTSAVSCNGGNDGSANISLSGGVPPYTYAWDDPGTQSNSTATGLTAGTYIVSVFGSDSCTTTATVVVTEPSLLTASASGTSASCGANDGQAMAVGAGGTGSYTYLWDDSLAQVTDTAINLAAGTYSVTITDANGCTATATAIVANPAAPTVTDSSVNVSCFGAADGEGYLFATGGTPPYTYSWDDPGTQTNANATGLSGGTYTGTVTDALGCIVSITITLTEPPNVLFPYLETFDSDSAYNSTGAPGTPVILLDNGWTNDQGDGAQDWAPRSIDTQTGNTGPSVDHTSGTGNYIYVEDGYDNDSVSLLAPCMNISGLCTPELSFWSHSYSTSGSISTLHIDIQYLGVWNLDVIPAIVVESNGWKNKLVDLSPYPDAIVIRFRVDNNNGTPFHDIAIDDVEVYDLAGFTSTTTFVDPSCPGATDGSASVTVVSGGVSPFTYIWDDPGNQTSSAATGLSDGTYSVTITDNAGCESVKIITITEPATPTLSMTTTAASCPGATDGTASVSILSGGVSPFTYVWNDPGTQTDTTATGLSAGTYSVNITDNDGCITTDSVTVTAGAGTTTLTLTSSAASCIGVCDGQATVTPSGGTPPYTYSWNDPGTQTNATAINLCIGPYTATVSDAQGCSVSDTVSVAGPAALVVTVTNIDSASQGVADGSATVSVTGGNPPYTYLWNDAGTQTTATATGLPTGNYTCTVTDANGCITIVNVTVPEAINPGVFEYEGLSRFDIYPNPTEGKVVFDIELDETGTIELQILNVLGKVIYSESISQVSKIRYEADLSKLTNGVYFIQLKSESVNANKRIVVTK